MEVTEPSSVTRRGKRITGRVRITGSGGHVRGREDGLCRVIPRAKIRPTISLVVVHRVKCVLPRVLGLSGEVPHSQKAWWPLVILILRVRKERLSRRILVSIRRPYKDPVVGIFPDTKVTPSPFADRSGPYPE